MAHKTRALEAGDLERVAVDTTLQPKAVAFPTDVRLVHKAIVVLATSSHIRTDGGFNLNPAVAAGGGWRESL